MRKSELRFPSLITSVLGSQYRWRFNPNANPPPAGFRQSENAKRMLASGLKYELDALANKDLEYLTKSYLRRKLKEKDLLD